MNQDRSKGMKYLPEQKGESKMSTKLTTTTKKNTPQAVKRSSPFVAPLRAPDHCHKMAVSSKKSAPETRRQKSSMTQHEPQRLLAPKPDICHVWCLDIWWNSTKKSSFLHLSTLPTSPLPVAVAKWRKEHRTTPALSVYTGCKSG